VDKLDAPAEGARGAPKVGSAAGGKARKRSRRTQGAEASGQPAPEKGPADRGPILVSVSPRDSPWLQWSEPLVPQGGQAVKADPAPTSAPAPKPRGVPLGAHLRAKLLTGLDTRTIGSGPVEAELVVPFVARGEIALPAHTLVYGVASEGSGRFNVRFTKLRLPDDTVVEFEGLALAGDDGKPGLAASQRIEAPPEKRPGLATKVAKGTGNILLDTITGGTAQDIARSAGQAALSHEEQAPASSGTILLLDAGEKFQIFVEHAF
jgi:hypothetical protein